MKHVFFAFATILISATVSFAGYCPFTVVNYNPSPVQIYFDMCSDCGKPQVAANGGTTQGTIAPWWGPVMAYPQDQYSNNNLNCTINPQGQGFTMIIGVDGQCTITKYGPCNAKRETVHLKATLLKSKDAHK